MVSANVIALPPYHLTSRTAQEYPAGCCGLEVSLDAVAVAVLEFRVCLAVVEQEVLKVEDFGERYKALSEHSRNQIFCAFRAIPLLFGFTADTNVGFSTDEFEQSFKLYNRTQIRPIQRLICDTYDWIYGQTGVLTITPFTLDGTNEQKVN